MERLLEDRKGAGDALRISVRMVDYLIAQGKLEAVKIGRRVMVKKQSIEKLARNGCTMGTRDAGEM